MSYVKAAYVQGENPVGYLGMKSPEEADGLHWFICIDSACTLRLSHAVSQSEHAVHGL